MKTPRNHLAGIGLYTSSEAACLIDVPASTLARWLRGHRANGRWHEPLWTPEINLGDDRLYLSFRDLLEARMAAAFISEGLSPQRVRLAIASAKDMIGERPLSTNWLKTDGRAVFLQTLRDDAGEPQLINLFTKQYAFDAIIDRSFRNIEFDGPLPIVWWPAGKRSGVLLDPKRSFGQPIECETSIPTAVLCKAVQAEGSIKAAATAWGVAPSAFQRAATFQQRMAFKKAA